MFVEMRKLPGAVCSCTTPVKARDLHARQYHASKAVKASIRSAHPLLPLWARVLSGSHGPPPHPPRGERLRKLHIAGHVR
jgi:hypothetical protein